MREQFFLLIMKTKKKFHQEVKFSNEILTLFSVYGPLYTNNFEIFHFSSLIDSFITEKRDYPL